MNIINPKWKIRNRQSFPRFSYFLLAFALSVKVSASESLLINSSQDSSQTFNEIEQNRQITGRILDKKDNSPLPGATIKIKGTSHGTAADLDGNFRIDIPKGVVTLEVSFVGYHTRVITVGKEKKMTIFLENEASIMSEVVVTGYANIDKKTFTGNVKTIKSDELLTVSRTNVLKAISSFDPSFRIAENNLMGSDPNSLPDISIRGHSSIGTTQLDKDQLSKSALEKNPNTPTFIMDGFEVSIQKVYDMDPNRIESITILKDAAATAMYGSRAANGVVVITTKAPKAGKVRISYNMTGTLEIPDLSDYNLMNAKEKLEAERLAGLYDAEPDSADPYSKSNAYWDRWNEVYIKGIDTDWMSQPLRNAFKHRHSINIESGNDKIRYSFDLNYASNNGVMKGSTRDNVGAGFKVYVNIGKLQVSNDVTYTNTSSKESPYGNFSDYAHQLPYDRFADDNGDLLKRLEWANYNRNANPLYEATLGNFSKDNQDEIIDNLQLRWDMGHGFTLQGSLGMHKAWTDNNRYVDPRSRKSSVKLDNNNLKAGDLFTDVGNSSSWNARMGLSYNANIGKNNMNFSVNGEMNERKNYMVSTHYIGFAEGTSADINYASEVQGKPRKRSTTSRYVGVNGIFNYSYNNIYLSDLSIRYEGSSIFGKNQQSTPYWSGGLGINIHNYDFLRGNKYLSRLKIRASYGQVGNVNFEPHMSHNYFKSLYEDWYITGYGTSLYYMGNPNLESEKTNTFDISADLGFLNDRISVNVTYYNKKTVDMINDVTIPTSAGFRTYKDNIGEVQNRGVEASIYATLVNKKDWYVSVNANFASNKEKFLKIAESLKRYNEEVNKKYEDYDLFPSREEYSKIYTKYVEGGSTTAMFGMKSLGIDPANGKEVFLDRRGNVTYEYDPREQVIIGDEAPKGQGSFGFNVRYKNVTLNSSFRYEFGGDRYNQTLVDYVENADIEHSNVDRRVLTDRWQKPGDITMLKDIKDRGTTTRATSRFMQEYNCLSMTSLSLQYEFAKKICRSVGIERMRLEANTGELFRISSVKQERGLSYPFARNFNFTLMVNF